MEMTVDKRVSCGERVARDIMVAVATILALIIFLVQGGKIAQQQHENARLSQERSEALRRAELIVASSPLPTIMCTADGVITVSNLAAESLLGWPHEELIGQNSQVLIPERFRELHLEKMGEAVDEAMTYTGNWQVPSPELDIFALRRDGTELPLRANVRVIKYEDKIEFIMMMYSPPTSIPDAEPTPIEPISPPEILEGDGA